MKMISKYIFQSIERKKKKMVKKLYVVTISFKKAKCTNIFK